MSTLSVTNIKNASSPSNNIVLDSSGNATMAGTMAMATPFGMRNRVINGAMMIDQRNAGAAVTNNSGAAVYNVDRWYGTANGGGVWTAQQSTTVPNNFKNSLACTVTTADSSIAAGDYYTIEQRVEGLNVADFAWGTANAATVTLSFWVRSSVAGTYGVGFTNASYNRSYVATYTINSANTFEYKTITLPGDTSGTWLTTNSIGLIAIFDLGSGSNYNQTANTWSATASWRTSGCVNWIANSGATFYLTGVQLEVGSVATPFERRLYGQELALCQRYYETGRSIWAGYTNGASNYYLTVQYKVTKRASTTQSFSNLSASGFPASSPSVGESQVEYFRVDPTSNSSSTAAYYQFSWAASAEL